MEKKDLKILLDDAVEGLFYISETDSPFYFFQWGEVKTVETETIRENLKLESSISIEERTFEEFFSRLTEEKEWFGEREKKIVEEFLNLKFILEKKLTNIKVFRIGRIQIDVYIAGLDSENRLTGIKTKSVET
jgi:Nuclease A inhibitor-like protein